jgi:hypothetical protein
MGLPLNRLHYFLEGHTFKCDPRSSQSYLPRRIVGGVEFNQRKTLMPELDIKFWQEKVLSTVTDREGIITNVERC